MTAELDIATPVRTQASRRLRYLIVVLCSLTAAVLLAVIERVKLGNGQFTTTDLQVYWQSGIAVRTGADPYQFLLPQAHIGFMYTPFAGLLLAPLSLLSLDAFRVLWFIGISLALQAVVWRLTGWVGMPAGWPRLLVSLAAMAALPLFDPFRQEFWSGQINVFLMLLVLIDLSRRDGSRGRGVAIGLAAGIKLVPSLFIVYFLVTRRFREAAIATATFAATVVVGFVALPGPAWHYWTSYAWDVERAYPHTGIIYNQNVRAALARLLHRDDVTLPWLIAAVLVAVVGVTICAGLHRRGREREGAVLCGVVAMLVSPISWVYHWVWLVAVFVVLVAGAWRAQRWRVRAWWIGVAAATAVIAFLHPYTWIGDYAAQPSGLVQQLDANALVILGLLLLVAGAVLWLLSPRGRPALPPPALWARP